MIARWYARLTRRERLLLLLTMTATLLAGWYLLLWTPLSQALQGVESRLSGAVSQRQAASVAAPEDAPWLAQATQWVPTGELSELLRHLTSTGKEVRLLGMEVRTPRLLFSCGAGAGQEGGIALFRHELMLTLEGGYPALLTTLHRLEQKPGKLYLDHLDYQLTSPSQATLRLHLHFASTAKTLFAD